MGAAGSVPASIEEAREQGISEEDITKYIVEHEGDVIVAAAGSDPDEKTEDVTDKTAESSSAPDEKTEDAIDKTTESSSEPDEKTEDAIAYEVGMKVEVSSQYGWDPAKVTAVQGDGKYTVFSYSGYYLNETVEDIPGNRIRASTAVEEKKEPPDEYGMQIGLAVEVCDCFGSDGQWLPAVITCIQEDGDYTVECTEGYYLGDTEEGVIFDRIRLEGEEKEYVDYTKMTVRKLRDMLRTRGAEAARLGFPDKELYKTKGRKTQLIERLIEADQLDAERAKLAPVSEVEKRRREEEARLAALRAAHAAKLERANFPVREAMAEAAMIPLPEVSELQRVTHALDDGTDTISFQPPSSDEEEEEEEEEEQEEEEVETPAEDGEKAANDDASGNNQQVVEGKADVVEAKTDGAEAKKDEAGAKKDEAEAKTDEADGKTDGAEAKEDEAGAKKDEADGKKDEVEEEKKTVVDEESKEDQSQESKKTDDAPKEKPINWKAVSEDIRIVHRCFVEKNLPYLDLSMKRIDGDALAAIIEESDPKLHTLKCVRRDCVYLRVSAKVA